MDLIVTAFCADLTSTLEVQTPDFLIFVTECVHFRPPKHLSKTCSPLKSFPTMRIPHSACLTRKAEVLVSAQQN